MKGLSDDVELLKALGPACPGVERAVGYAVAVGVPCHVTAALHTQEFDREHLVNSLQYLPPWPLPPLPSPLPTTQGWLSLHETQLCRSLRDASKALLALQGQIDHYSTRLSAGCEDSIR